MITISTIKHLRLPFSFFLLPEFLLAIVISNSVNVTHAALIFVILHFFLYPASHGFNSYYDRDEDSIGALKKPPRVTPDLFWVSIFLDIAAVALAYIVHPLFAAGAFVYGLASKAYSWDRIRIKKYPVLGWLFVGFWQGLVIFIMSFLFLKKFDPQSVMTLKVLIPALLSGVIILGIYPLTQIYQHKEDSRRGDMTISLCLGIRGTFYLSVPFVCVDIMGLAAYFYYYFSGIYAAVFLMFMMPSALYLIAWCVRVFRDEAHADFDSVLRIKILATSGLNLFCLFSLGFVTGTGGKFL